MPKKKGGKKGGKKKGKKPVEDWGERGNVGKWVTLEICNSEWKSMRFTARVPTTTLVRSVVDMIVETHEVAAVEGLQLYLGDTLAEDAMLRLPDDILTPLHDLKVVGGAMNDHVKQVITYVHPPFKSILNLPRGTPISPLRVVANC